MRTPRLKAVGASLQTVDVFGGYNHNLRIGDGEFYDMKNMTSDFYPVLSPRGKRGVAQEITDNLSDKINGIVTNNGLCYVDGNQFVLPDGTKADLGLSEGVKNMVSMGAYVIILPDKKWINVADCLDAIKKGEEIPKDAYGDIETSYSGNPEMSLCNEKGDAYENVAKEKPANPMDGQLWLDVTEKQSVLKKWAEDESKWMVVNNSYTKLATHDYIPFEKGDTVDIDAAVILGTMDIEGLRLVVNTGVETYGTQGTPSYGTRNFIVINGEMRIVEPSKIKLFQMCRRMPEMDFIIESGNRLWGCKYGSTENGFVNEIYASKLGDFKNWYCFQGVSTDSYTASIGADGPFTGAINYNGRPIFFKENCMIEVYGAYPAQYQVQTTPCNGVQQGCEKSLAIVNNVLFYKSRAGVCAFDGSLPTMISKSLGDLTYSDAVAGGVGNKYYVSMKGTDGQWNLFAYDMAKGMWHKEDHLEVDTFCSYQNELYGISKDRKTVFTMLGSGETDTAQTEWMVQSGEIGLSLPDMKYVSRLVMRLSMELGAQVSVYAHYDSSDYWEHLHTLTGTDLRSFSIPIRPKRCDHMQLRLEGRGNVKIYSITKAIEQGGDIT